MRAGERGPGTRVARIIEWDGSHPLAVEVQQHVDEHTVRGVALQEPSGLRRGERAWASGEPTELLDVITGAEALRR